MRAFILALSLVACATLATRTEDALARDAADAGGQIVEYEVPAPSLKGNLIGTPTTQAVSVYLPSGYDAHPRRHYPAIYLLHGYGDTRKTWLDYIHIKDILDRDIAAGRIPETVVVMPDAANVYGGGFYRNSPVTGRWADYIADDLIRYIDGHVRTLAREGGRAVVGWSMGGLGAISQAMDRPGLYAAAYAISPCCLAPIEDAGYGNDAVGRAMAFRSPDDIKASLAKSDFYPVAVIALLAAFSPDPNNPPFYVRFPFKEEDHQLAPDDSVYDAFLARFPLYRVEAARAALARLRAFGIDYGIEDQFADVPAATRALSAKLAELRIPHRFEVYRGNHRNRVAERLETVVLPFVANVLDKPE